MERSFARGSVREGSPACVTGFDSAKTGSELLRSQQLELVVEETRRREKAGLTLEHAEDTALPTAAVQVRVGVESRREIPRVVSDMRVRSAGQDTSEARSEACVHHGQRRVSDGHESLAERKSTRAETAAKRWGYLRWRVRAVLRVGEVKR